EAIRELDRLAGDFPDARETAANSKRAVQALEADRLLGEIERSIKAQQPSAATAALKAFPAEGSPPEVLAKVRELLRRLESTGGDAGRVAGALSRVASRLPSAVRIRLKPPLVEVLRGLAEAPDAALPRLEPFRTAESQTTPPARFALALSG